MRFSFYSQCRDMRVNGAEARASILFELLKADALKKSLHVSFKSIFVIAVGRFVLLLP